MIQTKRLNNILDPVIILSTEPLKGNSATLGQMNFATPKNQGIAPSTTFIVYASLENPKETFLISCRAISPGQPSYPIPALLHASSGLLTFSGGTDTGLLSHSRWKGLSRKLVALSSLNVIKTKSIQSRNAKNNYEYEYEYENAFPNNKFPLETIYDKIYKAALDACFRTPPRPPKNYWMGNITERKQNLTNQINQLSQEAYEEYSAKLPTIETI